MKSTANQSAKQPPKLTLAPPTHKRLRAKAQDIKIPMQDLGTHLLDAALDLLEEGQLEIRKPKVEFIGTPAAS